MSRIRTLLVALSAVAAGSALLAGPSAAVVGGHDTSDPRYKGVAEVTLAKAFGCTGTLIAPQWVLTAGHCGSITGGTGVATPASFPPQAIDVRMGSNQRRQGKLYPVAQVIVEPDYLLTDGYDITLLKLVAPTTGLPVSNVANASERALWSTGTLEKIVGWGLTSEDGSAPKILQEASVPIVADSDCAKVYRGFENRTQVCAGYPAGGVDTCQGDSGGPLFGETAVLALRVVGATSYGEGCARPGKYGVYARVADDTLRGWIATVAPDAVAP